MKKRLNIMVTFKIMMYMLNCVNKKNSTKIVLKLGGGGTALDKWR